MKFNSNDLLFSMNKYLKTSLEILTQFLLDIIIIVAMLFVIWMGGYEFNERGPELAIITIVSILIMVWVLTDPFSFNFLNTKVVDSSKYITQTKEEFIYNMCVTYQNNFLILDPTEQHRIKLLMTELYLNCFEPEFQKYKRLYKKNNTTKYSINDFMSMKRF